MCCPSSLGRSDAAHCRIMMMDNQEEDEQELTGNHHDEERLRSNTQQELERRERLQIVGRLMEEHRRKEDPLEIFVRQAEEAQFYLLNKYEYRRQQGGLPWFWHREAWDTLRIEVLKYKKIIRRRSGEDLTPEEKEELQEIEERKQIRRRKEIEHLLDALLFVS